MTDNADFTDLIDVASQRLGGRALMANDEFFAPKEDLLKPSTPPGQHIEVALLNPGVAVENMTMNFQLQSLDTMRIEGGEAKVVGGRFLIEPVTWVFGPQRQQFALAVEDAPIQEILKLFNNPDLKGTGILRGRIPMAMEDGHMFVEKYNIKVTFA